MTSKAPGSGSRLRCLATSNDDSRHVSDGMVESFGALIYSCRKRLAWSQATAAEVAGISCGYLSELENCRRPAPPMRMVQRIARALNMTVSETRALVCLAQLERTQKSACLELPRDVRDLLDAIVIASPHLSPDLVRHLQSVLEEARM